MLVLSFMLAYSSLVHDSGDIFHEYRVNTSVNYPAYGAAPADVVMKRLDHIRQACELVSDFAKSYEGVKVWKLKEILDERLPAKWEEIIEYWSTE